MELVFGTYASWSHLVVRLALGVIFFAHGSQKLFGWFGGHGLKGTIGYFRQNLGIPAAVGLIIVMLVAVSKVHAKNGLFINFALTPGKGHGYEFNLALIAMALSILIGGAGAVSIDRLIAPW